MSEYIEPSTVKSRSTTHQLIINSISTYIRLAGTLIIGLFLTRYLVPEDRLGLPGHGLFLILLSGVGLLTFVQTTIRSGLIRELSDAFHVDDKTNVLSKRFSAAVILSFIVGIILASLMLLGTPLAVWIIQFPDDFATQVPWVWVTLSLELAFLIWTVPFTILFDARHRIPTSNFIQLCERASTLVAALIVFGLNIGRSTPLLSFVIFDSSIKTGIRLLFALFAYMGCSEVKFRISYIEKSELHKITITGKYALMQEIATNLYNRTNQLLTNLFLGAKANSVFGASIQLKEYSRQVGLGLCFGIEPLAARYAAEKSTGQKSVGNLVLMMTRIQSGVIFPVVAFVITLAHPLVEVWLRNRVNTQWPNANYNIANMIIILLAGNTFFVIAQGMLRIMLGAGHVKYYSTKLLYAGIIQALIATCLYLLFSQWLGIETYADKAYAMYAICLCMSIVQIFTYGIYLPMLACRLYELRLFDMYFRSFLPGLIVGIIAAGVSAVSSSLLIDNLTEWSLGNLALILALVGIITIILAYFIVLTSDERNRILNQITKILSFIRRQK